MPGRNGGKNGEHARNERRLLVSRLFKEGADQMTIAAHLGVHQSTVSRDVAALTKQWHAESLGNVADVKCRELARLDLVIEEAWRAWHESTRPLPVPAGKGQVAPPALPRPGDPAYLKEVREALHLRAKIFGFVGAEGVRLQLLMAQQSGGNNGIPWEQVLMRAQAEIDSGFDPIENAIAEVRAQAPPPALPCGLRELSPEERPSTSGNEQERTD